VGSFYTLAIKFTSVNPAKDAGCAVGSPVESRVGRVPAAVYFCAFWVWKSDLVVTFMVLKNNIQFFTFVCLRQRTGWRHYVSAETVCPCVRACILINLDILGIFEWNLTRLSPLTDVSARMNTSNFRVKRKKLRSQWGQICPQNALFGPVVLTCWQSHNSWRSRNHRLVGYFHALFPGYSWCWRFACAHQMRGVVGNAFRMEQSYSTPGPVST